MRKETTAVFFDVEDTLYDLAWPFRMAVHDMFQGRYDDSIDSIFIRSRFHTDARFEEFSDGKDFKNTNSSGDFGKSGGSGSNDDSDDLFS